MIYIYRIEDIKELDNLELCSIHNLDIGVSKHLPRCPFEIRIRSSV